MKIIACSYNYKSLYLDVVGNINEDVICVLKYDRNLIIIDYEPIFKNYTEEIKYLQKLTSNSTDNLLEITDFVLGCKQLRVLDREYRYCRKLNGTYQKFTGNVIKLVDDALLEYNKCLYVKESLRTASLEETIELIKAHIFNSITLWLKAYNIELSYQCCFSNKHILTYSHRISGWSNPVYNLSQNFSVELKTNFGFGSASYLYVKIKYKNVEIIPFSEWIDYEIAEIAEIVRYSKSFSRRIFVGFSRGKKMFKKEIVNEDWLKAIEYTQLACNCSLKSENEFLEKYVVEECEKMVFSLESFFDQVSFSFEGESDCHYTVDKKGHSLIEFQGEKICGALDFITAILEFDAVTPVLSFVDRIVACNRLIRPILIKEVNVIESRLPPLGIKLEILSKEYLSLVDLNNRYESFKGDIQKELRKTFKYESWETIKGKAAVIFRNKYPEFEVFYKEYLRSRGNYKNLCEKIENLTYTKSNILSYISKVTGYMKKHNSFI